MIASKGATITGRHAPLPTEKIMKSFSCLFAPPGSRNSGIAWTLSAVIALCSGLCISHKARAEGLDAKILPKVQAATFEVVAAKPVEDNLIYVKPLPLDLLPFQERNDKYFSIGTAFSIGNNRYVTAAHVLDTGIGSLWGAPALRDSNGNVYLIDKIEKFSLPRDFAVFSLTGHTQSAWLQVNSKPDINSTVYAVGNALGTGVVVRDGLFTSKTPEEEDGRWSWLRFSAAASPGNSGGPLLDKNGKVIGVVLRKSANENLNYALPIDEVIKAPDHRAEIDDRASYQLDVLDTVQNDTFKAQFSLPLSFSEFGTTFEKLSDDYSDAQLGALLAKERDKIFPHGIGSNRLLHHVARMQTFPALITRQRDGDWVLSEKTGKKTPLPGNGYVVPGIAGRNFLFHLHKPDDISAGDLYTNPEQLMNQLLKVGFLQRPVGTEKVQVVGMGKPTEDSIHVDTWQRRWQVRIWPLPFANGMFVTFSLPVPDGYVTMLRIVQARETHDAVIDLRALTDFVDVAYEGTLVQWRDFMRNDSLLPPVLKAIKIDFEDGRRFRYESPRVSFSFTKEVQPIGPENLLALGFGYLNDDGKVSWDVGDIRVQRDANDRDWINIERHVVPSEDLDDTYKSEWDKVVNRRHPYDGVIRTGEDGTKITAVADTPGATAPTLLYSGFLGVAGNSPQNVMRAKLDLLMKNLRVSEH
jgi:serine protease Do